MHEVQPGSALEQRIKAIEAHLGKRIILCGVRVPGSGFRGRITERRRHVVLEYRDTTPGFFWHYEIIEELLTYVEQGRGSATIFEGNIQYVIGPPPRRQPAPPES